MSFYSRMEGEIVFSDQDSFLKIINILKKGLWIDEEGHF